MPMSQQRIPPKSSKSSMSAILIILVSLVKSIFPVERGEACLSIPQEQEPMLQLQQMQDVRYLLLILIINLIPKLSEVMKQMAWTHEVLRLSQGTGQLS